MTIPRVGVGGPVGSGKTSLIEELVRILVPAGITPIVITNDIVTQEDATTFAPHLMACWTVGVSWAWRPAPVRTPRCARTRR